MAATATHRPGPARPLGRQTEPELVAAVRRGEDRAFEELYARYRRRIHAFVDGMVRDHGRAEDVSQEVFLAALRRMRETDRPIAFRAWVYEIARNACIDQHRRSSRAEEVSYHREHELADGDRRRLVSAALAPEAAVEARQQLDRLRGAFGSLSESHHRILVLRELEGLSYREIGERMGLSPAGVESTLFRARRRLGEEYAEARCRPAPAGPPACDRREATTVRLRPPHRYQGRPAVAAATATGRSSWRATSVS